ncbi:MAG: DNA-formamidopyrimidine glycosylase [Candidatus Omnitrophica bacterium]|nr:DNA-formamidopyrimidine glycosylase [Candidatus Omnitrophota bacterium]
MPELPEVETIKRQLQRRILNKKIVGVIVRRKNLIKEPSLAEFKKKLIGSTIDGIIRKGKLIIIALSQKNFLIVHLRISGWLEYGKNLDKARVSFELSNKKFLNYMDQRTLGELRLRDHYKDLSFVRTLGPEPFKLSPKEFHAIISKKKTKIKVLLLDQKVISGIGNIYAQEALFLSGIDPNRKADSINQSQASLLLEKIIHVLNEGIKYGGSSVDTYRNIEGNKGGMEERLKVYGRQKLPCFSCKSPISKISLAGRGTCFCPNCQK